jgi:hypothetical protein
MISTTTTNNIERIKRKIQVETISNKKKNTNKQNNNQPITKRHQNNKHRPFNQVLVQATEIGNDKKTQQTLSLKKEKTSC